MTKDTSCVSLWSFWNDTILRSRRLSLGLEFMTPHVIIWSSSLATSGDLMVLDLNIGMPQDRLLSLFLEL